MALQKYQVPHFFLLGSLFFLLFLTGCPKKSEIPKESLPPKSQLFLRVKMFNKFIRWKEYRRAKELVLPSLQAEYMLRWVKRRPNLRITAYAIQDLTIDKKKKKALVLIVQKRYLLPSITLQRVVFYQQWKPHHGLWFYEKDIPAIIKKKKSSQHQ